MSEDHIRQAIIDRAATLGLSAYAIARDTQLDTTTVKRYLDGKQQISSEKLAAICTLLELQLCTKRFRERAPANRPKKETK